MDFFKDLYRRRRSNLIEVQRESYNRFLQMDLIPEERDYVGLSRLCIDLSCFRFSRDGYARVCRIPDRQLAVQVRQPRGLETCVQCKKLFGKDKGRSVQPGRKCFARTAARSTRCGKISAITAASGRPQAKHDQQSARTRNVYSVPLKVKIRLTVYDKDPETKVATDAHQGGGPFLARYR